MNLQDFKRILVSFADNSSDVEVNKGKVTALIRSELIEVELIEKDFELYVIEDGIENKAVQWIGIRLAQLEQLSERIRDYIKPVDDFVNPSGKLLDDIDSDPSETERPIDNLCFSLREVLSRRIAGTTGVTYLTSDAGEGKTTIINQLSIQQANLYKQKKTKWLLVPIPLGGRTFLRFDDIVIASLVNRLRFRLFYYESFIELVKLGLIVPAFDGFEEMFMDTSSGEALSATGHLMAKLNSSGNVLIAARKAYFDYKNFSSQAKLFDTIGSNSVAFSRVSIDRWNEARFIEYTGYKHIQEGEEIYTMVSKTLNDKNHPLLTRPVLVSRLLEVVKSTEDIELLGKTLENPTHYFYNFVEAIIIREAETKWIDISGEPYKPLLTVKQHHELLAVIAEEMWINSTDSLSIDVIDLLADLYSESQGFNAKITSQVKERIKQHALLIRSDQNANQLKFDHEEFMLFYIGIALYRSAVARKPTDFKYILRKGAIHKQTIDSFIASVKNTGTSIKSIVELVTSIQSNEGPTSFVKENCGVLIIKLMSLFDYSVDHLDNYSFPSGWLENAELKNLTISNSNFQTTEISFSSLKNCLFRNCTFDGIELGVGKLKIENTILRDCEVLFIRDMDRDLSFYDPVNIEFNLKKIGFLIETSKTLENVQLQDNVMDKDLEITERALRRFIRGSHINDNVFRIRLGSNAPYFIDTILPILLEKKILEEVEHIGAGQKRRFKLAIPFERISDSLQKAQGNFKEFLKILEK